MRKKLVIAGDVDRALVRRFENDDRFECAYRPVRSEDELAAVARDAEILVTRSFHPVTRRVIASATRLELIAQGTSGINNIDTTAAADHGITIISTPGINANAVAELVIGSIITLTRTIPAYTREMSSGLWSRDDCASRHELRHYRLGIIGLGHVGRRLAAAAAFFGMRVAAYDPYLDDADFSERHASRASTLEILLTNSEIVSLHVPLTNETRRMIGARQILQMPRGSILINTARGEVLDQQAALEALSANHLAGLVLDVFDAEPPSLAFPDDPRLLLTPHIAGCSHESRSGIGARLCDEIIAFYSRRT
jgi:phosphoglycerate dehydrogenase-like enzyme